MPEDKRILEPFPGTSHERKFEILEKAIKRGAITLADAIFLLDGFKVEDSLSIQKLKELLDKKP